jgi:hypothetical protein
MIAARSEGMNLSDAQVIGFFSLPSPSLAEHNPDAYNNAMAQAPAGAGTCANCGTGIRHHVVVSLDGATHFIGTDCAERIGGEPARCVGARLTSDQLAKRQADQDARRAAFDAEVARLAAIRAERAERFADALAALRAQGSEFHRSLASQLVEGDLSRRQAEYVCKAVFGPRQNKRNREAWYALEDAITGADAIAA